MIIDPRVFEDVYLPRELAHRESEVGQLSRAFQPALSGSTPHNALISGPSGVGKTVLARHTLGQLEKHASLTLTSEASEKALGRSFARRFANIWPTSASSSPRALPSTTSVNFFVIPSNIHSS